MHKSLRRSRDNGMTLSSKSFTIFCVTNVERYCYLTVESLINCLMVSFAVHMLNAVERNQDILAPLLSKHARETCDHPCWIELMFTVGSNKFHRWLIASTGVMESKFLMCTFLCPRNIGEDRLQQCKDSLYAIFWTVCTFTGYFRGVVSRERFTPAVCSKMNS